MEDEISWTELLTVELLYYQHLCLLYHIRHLMCSSTFIPQLQVLPVCSSWPHLTCIILSDSRLTHLWSINQLGNEMKTHWKVKYPESLSEGAQHRGQRDTHSRYTCTEKEDQDDSWHESRKETQEVKEKLVTKIKGEELTHTNTAALLLQKWRSSLTKFWVSSLGSFSPFQLLFLFVCSSERKLKEAKQGSHDACFKKLWCQF